MTEPETKQPVPKNERTRCHRERTTRTVAAGRKRRAKPSPPPPPEPWTPERVSEWNAYYDFYVKLAALLLVFMVACNYVTDTQVWLHLKTGQLIAEQGWPYRVRRFLLARKRVGNGSIFRGSFSGLTPRSTSWLSDLVPVSPADPTANRGTAEGYRNRRPYGYHRPARLATAWLLLKIRRRGPGVWWSALVVAPQLGRHLSSGLRI